MAKRNQFNSHLPASMKSGHVHVVPYCLDYTTLHDALVGTLDSPRVPTFTVSLCLETIVFPPFPPNAPALLKALPLLTCVSGKFEVVSPTVVNYQGGMRANYTVEKCSFTQRQGEFMIHSKTFYIAAVETDWDYSPNRTWEAEMYRGQEKYGTACERTAV